MVGRKTEREFGEAPAPTLGKAEIGYRAIRRDRGNPVGLSMRDGEPLESLDDLPDHRVVAHVFPDADGAAAFVAGVRLLGTRNAVDVCWHVGDTVSNRVVFVAYFDEPRRVVADLSDAVETVSHAPTGHDGEAIARTNRESSERNRLEREETLRLAQPVREAVAAAGYGQGSSYRGSFSFGDREHSMSVEWKDEAGPWKLRMSVSHLSQYDPDPTEMVAEACSRHGLFHDRVERDVVMEDIRSLSGIPAALASIMAAEEDWERMRKEAWEARFRASVKLTAARKRFLRTGVEDGIRSYVNRADMHLRTGSEDITRSEISVLQRMGWIANVRDGWVVTDEGRAVVGLAPATSVGDDEQEPSGPRM